MQDRIILIIGFMAAGKTTVAEALALQLNLQAADLDSLITTATGSTPKDIIERHGEGAFRTVETRVLRETLETRANQIIALGGGSWSIGENRRLSEEHNCWTVWLDAPFDLCWQRIVVTGSQRPLARDEQQARRLYTQRQADYTLAQVHIQTSNKSVTEISKEIEQALRSRNS